MIRVLSLSATVAFLSVADASAQTWQSQYFEAESADEISTCNAFLNYRNASFVVRLSGKEMDFVYYRDDFTLPYDEVLGAVIVEFVGGSFALLASTNARRPDQSLPSAQTIFLSPRRDDYESIFDGLRLGRSFKLVFPNNSAYEFSLRGSSKALSEASHCWKTRPTGKFENNPFSGAAPTAPDNPFSKPKNNNPFSTGTEGSPEKDL